MFSCLMEYSIRANRDCYVIIRHIDVNDTSRLIFPNRGDFEFSNPSGVLREIADYVRQKGGGVEGDDNEGFYTIDNERVNYKVHGNGITLITRLPPQALSRSLTRGMAAPLQIDLAIPRTSIPGQIASTGDKMNRPAAERRGIRPYRRNKAGGGCLFGGCAGREFCGTKTGGNHGKLPGGKRECYGSDYKIPSPVCRNHKKQDKRIF